jgi:hypothetical protein
MGREKFVWGTSAGVRCFDGKTWQLLTMKWGDIEDCKGPRMCHSADGGRPKLRCSFGMNVCLPNIDFAAKSMLGCGQAPLWGVGLESRGRTPGPAPGRMGAEDFRVVAMAERRGRVESVRIEKGVTMER